MAESKRLPPLTSLSQPHRGTKEYPGGQMAWIQAAIRQERALGDPVDDPGHDWVTVLLGRDSGKTVFLYFLFMEEGMRCTTDYACAYVGQTHARATDFYRWCLSLWSAANLVIGQCNDGQDRWIQLKPFGRNKGFKCYFWSGEPGAIEALRGTRLNRLGIDEPGYVSSKVLPTCIPMMNTRAGRAVAVGTARRDGMGFGWFKDMYDRGWGKVVGENGEAADPLTLGMRFKSFNAPSESNPFNPPDAFLTLPDGTRILKNRLLFRDKADPYTKTPEEREEFDGAFISDLGACFKNLDACFSIKAWRQEGSLFIAEPPRYGARYVIGQDWAARDDHSISSVFDRDTRKQVALRIEPSGANVEFSPQLNRLDSLKRAYNDALIVADGNSVGLYISEELRRRYGDGVRDCNLQFSGENAKGTHVARVRHFFEEARWHLMDLPAQRAEFTEFRQEPIGPHSNGFRYTAPPGKHDDMVLAALYASTVLQFDAPPIRMWDYEEPLIGSREWFDRYHKPKRHGTTYVIGSQTTTT